MLALVFIICLGLLVGFRFHNSFGASLTGIALIIGFGYAFTWVYAAIGLAVKDPQTAQMTSILPVLILFFASSALVPVSTMPGWLQPFAQNQPASVTINSGPGSVRRWTRVSRTLAGSPLVRRDLCGLLSDLVEPLSESDGMILRDAP